MQDVLLGGQPIGKVEITRQGMYDCFHCRCRLSGEVAYKVVVYCEDRSFDLGLLVPENGAFCLTSRINRKLLGEGEMKFLAVPRGVKELKGFVPLSPNEPFSYLSRLENAYLQRKNGVLGICFKD